MASRDNSPAISFFSFQDIITSITGIMFLVVIMLVLMVLEQSAAPSHQKSRELQQELIELEKELQELRDMLARFSKQAQEQQNRIEELKKLRLDTLPGLKAKWIAKLQEIDQAILLLEDENEQLLQSRKDQTGLREKTVILVKRNEDLINRLRTDLVALDEQIKQKEILLRKFKNVIRFVWDRSNAKNPILLECGETEISVNSLDDKVPRRTFTSYSECMAYCRTFPVDRTYFILLLKPSAFYYGERFLWELQKAGYERGREVLPDEQTLIAGEKEK